MEHEVEPPFRPNLRLETLLAELNREIAGGAPPASERELPVLLLVGCPRSGATLLLQWLARSGAFGYASNLIARFWKNPRVGALVQEMLTRPELDFRGELTDVRPAEIAFTSDLGKTTGLLGPNEFWYFWTRFFVFGETHCLTPEQLEGIDSARLETELQALAAVFDRPLVLKAHLLSWHIDFLARALPSARFVFIDRDPFFVMQSLIEARRRYFGTDEGWYSIKPAEHASLARQSPWEQVAGQVHAVRRTVTHQLAELPSERWTRIAYEELCADPAAIRKAIGELLPAVNLRWERNRPAAEFSSANQERLTSEEARPLRAAYARLEAGETRAGRSS